MLHQKDPSERLCFIFDLIDCPLTATFISGPNGQSEAGPERGRQREKERVRERLMYSQPSAWLDQNVLVLMETMVGSKGTGVWMDA